jgi:phage FluMu protein Com
MEKLPDRKRVLCGNPKCQRFLCAVEIHVPELGEIAEIFDMKCPKCGRINSFKVKVQPAKKAEK